MLREGPSVADSLFVTFPLREAIRTTTKWIRLRARWWGPKQRFVPLSPPPLTRQIFFDRAQGKRISVRIRNVIDYYVAKDVFTDRAYQLDDRAPDIQKFYEAVVASGRKPLIIDCGANSGMATRYYKETYPAAHVVAVEPVATNLELAKENNSASGIDYYLAGIGCEEGRAAIQNPDADNWGYRTELDDEGPIEIISVNKLLSRYAALVPFIIKIDIEGFENNLFSRNTEWLDKFPLLVMETHDWMLPRAGNSRNFLREVSKFDRDFLFHAKTVFSVSNTLPF